VARSPVLSRLATTAGSLVDGAVVRFMERAMSKGAPRRPPSDAGRRLDELAARYGAAAHFEDANTFFRPPRVPAVRASHVEDLAGGGALVDLVWASAYEPFLPEFRDEHQTHAENLLAHARWWRSPRPRRALVCIHGWGGGNWAFEARAFPVDYFRRLGWDVLLFALPYHGRRAPAGRRSGELFPSAHVVRTNEAFAQAVHDLRALAAWLGEQDVPAVGVTGMSLGGYTTALAATVMPELAAAAPMIPAVSMSDLMWRHGEGTPSRRRAAAAGVTRAHLDAVFRVHAPTERPCVVPAARRFIIAGRGDRITPPDQAERLWQHWGRPPIHWFPGGHLAQVGRGDAFRAMGRWLRTLD
jgi:pimeloyl-ACP methyl ester carboxylesterase